MININEIIRIINEQPLLRLTPENVRNLRGGPGIYVVYLCGNTSAVLYVGSSVELYNRIAQLIDFVRFDHTFTWRLFCKEFRRRVGRKAVKSYREIEDRLWYEMREIREEIIGKLKELFSKLCFKYIDSRIYPPLKDININELRSLEKAVADKLKPINPHLKDIDKTIDDLLHMASKSKTLKT